MKGPPGVLGDFLLHTFSSSAPFRIRKTPFNVVCASLKSRVQPIVWFVRLGSFSFAPPGALKHNPVGDIP
jgi:hypothetical protein